jgi:hypothetical protein
MKTGQLLILSLFLLSFAVPTRAIKVDSLYRGSVPVASQSALDRTQAVQSAITQVLIKVSGNSQIVNNTELKAHLNSAETLVQEFSYVSVPATNNKQPYLLTIQFDANGINQWLRDAGAPIWGQNRPLMVAWVEFEVPPRAPEIISSDNTHEIAAFLKRTAEQRGLPLMLPLMDMADLNQASVKDVMEMSVPPLMNAAKRYASDALLIGRIVQNAQGIATQWKLTLDQEEWSWSLAGKTLSNVIPVLIDNVADTLATRYAVITTNHIQKDFMLTVTGINHYEDFAHLTRYLNHLTPVANVEILQVTENNTILLKVSLRSTEQSFIQALSLAKKLTAVTHEANTMAVYQWNP